MFRQTIKKVELQLFNFNSNDIKVLVKDGEPWFSGREVCAMLGLVFQQSAYRKLGETEKSYVDRKHLGLKPGKPMVFVNESGLYKLILRSDKPAAKKFQDWVTREVLPAIRKDGSYVDIKRMLPLLGLVAQWIHRRPTLWQS